MKRPRLLASLDGLPLTDRQRTAIADFEAEARELRATCRCVAQRVRSARQMIGADSFAGLSLLRAAEELEAAAQIETPSNGPATGTGDGNASC